METTIPFNILLLPLLGGFAFVSIWNYTRWHAVRASRERLIFYAAIAGFFSLIIVFSIKLFIAPLFPCSRWSAVTCLPTWWETHVPFEYSGLSTGAFGLAAVLGFLLNFLPWFDKDKQAERIVKKEGGPLEQFLDVALKSQKEVLVTLANGKVYLGPIASSFPPDGRDKTITLLPSASGYREHPSQRLIFTTEYEDIYLALEQNDPEQIGDFRVTVPIREVRSVTFFNRKIHRDHFGGGRVVSQDQPKIY